MTTSLKRYLAVLLASLGFALPASATTFSIDYTDLWYASPAESESGWGINIIQQNEIIFATMFVYGSDNTPRWFSASNMGPGQTTGTFSGPLYTSIGSYYGNPWNTSQLSLRQVGNIAIDFSSPNNGRLTYNVDGVNVVKNITRVTTRNENLSGNWFGGTVGVGANCTGGILISGELTVNHSGSAVSMFVDFTNSAGQPGRCSYTGTYSQQGSMGSVDNGSYNCTIGGVNNAFIGSFSIGEIRTSRNGFNGRISATSQFCAYSGFFGGVRDVF